MRLLPGDVEVRDEAVDEEQIQWAVTHHLVGDADAVAPGVASLRSHAASLAPGRPAPGKSVPVRR